MSDKAKRRSARVVWAIVLVAMALLVFWDITSTVAQKRNRFINPILMDLLYEPPPKQNSVVGICQSTDPELGGLAAPLSATLTYQQVDSITRFAVQRAGGFGGVVLSGDWVVIKPNILTVPGVPAYFSHNGNPGICTDLRVVKSVIEQLIEQGNASRITVAEGKSWRNLDDPDKPPEQTEDGWTYHWSWYGGLSYEDMLDSLDDANPTITIDYIDLDYPPYTETPVPGGGLSRDSYFIPDCILDCDRVIAVAVMKDHNIARVTLTHKLYIGISPGTVYGNTPSGFNHYGVPHGQYMGRTICDLVSYHPPDFGIVECFWGRSGGGPLGGTSIQRNVVLAGKDPVAVDAAAAYSMGLNPWDIDHLHWSHNKGYGINNLDYITVNGPSLDDIKYEFGRTITNGRCNRTWLVNGTYDEIDINVDSLGGEASAAPVMGDPGWEVLNEDVDYIDLATHFGGSSSCIAYAFTRIIADSAGTVSLRFGSDDGIKIWLNGDSIFVDPNSGSYGGVQEEDIDIPLQEGVNRLLVKIKNTSGAYGFSVRVSEPNGNTPLWTRYSILGPGAPEITLNLPGNGATTTNPYMELSAWVSDSDEDTMTVWIYGDTTTGASALLCVQEVCTSGSYITYNWKARTLEPDANTIGLWHFDEGSGDTMYDASANGLDGFWWCDSTLDSAWTTDAPFGYALHFYGFRDPAGDPPCNADWVEVPDAPGLNFEAGDPISIEFWLKLDYMPSRNMGFVSKRPHSDPADSIYAGGAANYEIYYTPSPGFFGFFDGSLHPSNIVPSVGEWQYIAVTLDSGGELRFYENGELSYTYPEAVSVGPTTWEPLRIGCSVYAMKAVPGLMDEVRISNSVRDSAEIAENYKLGVGRYHWKVAASDGVDATTSETRYFDVEAAGPDTLPPEITLLYPSNDSTTNHPYMELSVRVLDESPTTVWIYGDTTTNPASLLYTEEDISGTQVINYTWSGGSCLEPEASHTIGLWHFDENGGDSAYDAGSNGNHGELVGGPVWTSGRFESALNFDGSNDFVSITDNPTVDIPSNGALTMEAWVYPHAHIGSIYRTIIGKRNSSINYQMSLDRYNGNLLYYSGGTIWTSSVYVPLDEWSYVAITLDGTEDRLRFYRNGVYLDSLDGAGFGAVNDAPLTIGVTSGDPLREPFDGLIDEVRITDRVLSPAEIASNYGLKNGTYYWWVEAEDALAHDSISEIRWFNVVLAPDIPALINPPDLVVINDNTPTFDWSSTTGSGGTYSLEHALDADFTISKERITGISDTTYTISDPDALSDTTYYWHVQAYDAGGDSSGYQTTPFSFTVTFDTLPPEITLLSPINGSVTANNYVELSARVSDEHPMMVWIYGDSTPDPTALLYVEEDVTGTDTVDYYWSAPVLEPEAGYTIGLWHFDEGVGSSVYDSSDNSNHGTFSGDPQWSASGRFGYALDFDGTDDYVVIPDHPSLDVDSATGALTMEAWIYPDSVGGGRWRAIVAKRIMPGASCNYEMCLSSSAGDLVFYNGYTIWYSTVYVPPNEWSYVVITLDAAEGRARFYRNGVQSDSIDGVAFGPANTHSLCIGVANSAVECFDGRIDEVRLTNRLLTSAEITANHELGLGTYYWFVRAEDALTNDSTSQTWWFTLEAPGPDTSKPEITLLSPSNDSTTTNNHMQLSATVTDQSPMTVWIYGDTTTDATDLLYVEENVTGTDIIYDWTAPVLEPDTPNTMGLWHFDENTGSTVYDESDNGNDGTFSGDPAWTPDGQFGYAVDLDGAGDFVSVPDNASMDIDPASGALTMEAWVYPHVVGGGYRTIIGKKEGSAINYQMSLHTTSGNLLFYKTGGPIYTSTVYVPPNVWSYVAITLDATEGLLRFYRNGMQGDSIGGGAFGAANGAPVTLGATNNAGIEPFDGLIDEVRLTNRVLNSEEIAANHKLGSTYYWRVRAEDEAANDSTSETRWFNIGPSGPDTLPPEITLNYPPNDSTTYTTNYMQLSITVTDQSPMTVWIYGDTTTDATDLLYVEENVTGTDIIYDWTAPVLEPDTPNTMGLWHFDENTGSTVYDESDNGNDGTFSGDPQWTPDGRFGYALDFDGTDDCISIPDHASLDVDSTIGTLTMEAWLYPHSVADGYHTIFCKREGGPINYQMSLDATTGNLLFYRGFWPEIFVSSVYVPALEWSYVAITVNANTDSAIFYRNGIPGDTMTGVGFGPTIDGELYIGVNNPGSEEFNGLMDEMRLTNRVLGPEEIAANYRLGSTYYWRVRAEDASTNDSTSETWHFTVGTQPPPDIPTLIAPTDLAVLNDNTPLFEWSSTAGDEGTYTLEYALDNTFVSGLVTIAGVSDTFYTVPDGSALTDTIYYWHVQAHNAGGSSGYQATPFSYTVDTEAPDVPTLINPSDLAVINDNTPTFDWSSTAGVGGNYTLEYALDVGFTTGVQTMPGITDTTYTIPDPQALPDATYYWHVQAIDQASNPSGYQVSPFSFTLDTQAPDSPTDFTVEPGHEKCKLSWTNPTGDPSFEGVEIRRNPWAVGAYPEYDDDFSTPIGYPADETDGDLVYHGSDESYRDSSDTGTMPRNVYYYSIFSYDLAGNYSTLAVDDTARATNYWLGDVTGDGIVYYQDLTFLSNTFRASDGDPNYDPEFDIGPTHNMSPRGIPTTDDVIDFEDLVVFAINFAVVSPNLKVAPLFADQEISGPLALSLVMLTTDLELGKEFEVKVVLRNNPGTVKSMHLVLPYDPSQLEFVRVERSDKLKAAPYPLFFDGREIEHHVDVSLALLGGEVTIGGSGEIASITFRLLEERDISLSFSLIDLRDGENHKLSADQEDAEYEATSQVPSAYGLSQNYPNPYNPQTQIAYQLPEAGEVSLRIYNIRGELVRTLVDEYEPAGYHTVMWDGRNQAGMEVSSGIYLYRMISGKFSDTRKMVMIK